jgi:hypothetical protein
LSDQEKGVALNVAVLAQPWLQVTAPAASGEGSRGIGAADGESPSFEFFLRRARIMVYGSVNPHIQFFLDTDQPNFGKGGDFAAPMFVQDAFLTYSFGRELQIDGGMMLVPLSHHTIESAAGLNALDYHADLVRLPAGKVFRDTGLQFRGLVADDRIHYRLGVFEGVRMPPVGPLAMGASAPAPLNDKGLPRFVGQVRVNLLGSEPDFFLKGMYFSPTPILSIGVGADYQAHAVYGADGSPRAWVGLSADVFAEYPLSPTSELVFKANGFRYAEGSSTLPGTAPAQTVPGANPLPGGLGGTTFYFELGIRLDWIEPLAFVDYVAGKNDTVKVVAPHAGINFWVLKHAFNVKTDVGYKKTDTNVAGVVTTTKDVLGTVQAQLFF